MVPVPYRSHQIRIRIKINTDKMNMRTVRTLGIVLVGLFCIGYGATGYNTKAQRVSNKLNVHLVCHTHDDVGWLKTVDQYFYGSKQNIYKAGVQYILDTVLQNLLQNPDRKFTYVEMAFFTRWFNQLDDTKQDQVKKLVANKQLTFANGGWCMHDEAGAHYVGMVDQTTRGHQFLKETFNVTPTIGWQLDPFGHSAVQGYLLGVDLGFKGMVLGRSDYADLAKRKREKAMEFMWQPSPTFGSSKQILTQIRPDGNYQPPPGFCFDYENCQGEPVCDDPTLDEYNLDQRVEDFVRESYSLASMTRGNDILFTMGSDFQWANADSWYKNLDKLVHYVNKDGRVNVFYSTPEDYFDAKAGSGVQFPTKSDDFFPYADNPYAYWTGYYTSRPTQKHYVQMMQSQLQSARHVQYLTGGSQSSSKQLDKLEGAVSILMHHDAITGTAKQAVADDYAKRLYIGSEKAQSLLNYGFKTLLHFKSYFSQAAGKSYPALVIKPVKDLIFHAGEDVNSGEDFVQCPLLNVSQCVISEQSSAAKQNIQVVVYNNLAAGRKEYIHVPIIKKGKVAVFNGEMKPVQSQLTPVDSQTKSLRAEDRINLLDLSFVADVPPKGLVVFYIYFSEFPQDSIMATLSDISSVKQDVSILGDNLRLTFSGESGHLQTYENILNDISISANIEFVVYKSGTGAGSINPSGAYIFAPNGTLSILSENPTLKVVRGPVFEEIQQTFSSWVTLHTRIYKEDKWAQLQWQVGSIPIDDGIGKEISMRVTSGIQSGKRFLTDSNGRDMLLRELNYRPTWELNVTEPIAGNYYPLTAAIAIEDNDHEMCLLVDRAQGGTSLNKGDLEIMVHRRTVFDDVRGVDEALNETECGCRLCNCPGLVAYGVDYLHLDTKENSPSMRRALQLKQQEPVVVAFRNFDKMEYIPKLYGLVDGKSFPENVHLMTLHALDDTRVLVRLAHLFGAGEDNALSTAVEVDLSVIFPGRTIVTMSVMSLSANQVLSETNVKQGIDTVVTVNPLEIKTFIVELKSDDLVFKY